MMQQDQQVNTPIPYAVHTPAYPFCDDMSCQDCHADNKEAVKNLGEDYQNGLLTANEADNIYRGKKL